MPADKWNGNGDWEANPSDWSSGIPTPTTPAEIQTGTATISDGGFGEAQSLTIDGGAGVSVNDDASLNVTDWLNNVGGWSVGGGDTVSIGSRLTNSGAINIGNGGITASTTVIAASSREHEHRQDRSPGKREQRNHQPGDARHHRQQFGHRLGIP